MRKSSCLLITKKPLLLEGRKSHYFWMTKEVSIFAKTPFSSVTRGDVDTEEIITQEEYEFLKQRIERVMNCKLFFQSLGRFRLGVGVSFSADTPVTVHVHSLFLIDFKCLELLQDTTPEGRGRRTAHLAWVVATVARTALILIEDVITRAAVTEILFAAALLPFPFVLLLSSSPAWPSSSPRMTESSVSRSFSLLCNSLVGTMSMLRSGRETSNCRS